MIERLTRIISYSPSIIVLVVIAILVWRGISGQRDIAERYRAAARQAVAEDDLERAKFYYLRLVGAGDRGSQQDQLNWASILSASGDMQGALDQLDQLAPDDAIGYAPAHLEKAKSLAVGQRRARQADAEKLTLMAWHLKHGARESTVENDLLWGDYYIAMNQIDNAILRYSSAASRNPELWFRIAALYKRVGRKDSFERALARAETFSIQKLSENPLDVGQRLQLADIFAESSRFDDLKRLLGEGLRLTPQDAAMKRAASTYALLESKRVEPKGKDSEKRRASLLAQAGRLDPSNPRLYKELTELFSQAKTAEERASYRRQLESWIAEGESVAYAHFALGNLVWMEGVDPDKAIFHFQTALEIDEGLLPVANNLAWVLAHTEDPDLERAEELARLAYDANPDIASYNDTLAVVLFKQKRYRECLPLYEKVLGASSPTKKLELHERLAKIYEELGQDDIAQIHRSKLPKKAATAERDNDPESH